jgi:hypothetical protein
VWSARLDGSTFSSPALSDVLGDGSLQVVEGTDQGPGGSGSVDVLDGATGRTVWAVHGLGRVIGSVVTADLTGDGYDDVIAPTVNGAVVLDGRTGTVEATLSPDLGLQNAPLVTDDPDGAVGITLAGYVPSATDPSGVAEIDHYELPGTDGAAAVGAGAWPMFHHDPQLTGDAGGTPRPGSVPPCSVPDAVLGGYDLDAADGGVFALGGDPFCGSTGGLHLAAPVVGMAMAPATGGYWEVSADGGVFAFGGARFDGSMGGRHLVRPIVGMAATPDGGGYWEVAADGGVFCFGDARFAGSTGGQRLAAPVVALVPSTDGGGYRLVTAAGRVYSFGDALYEGGVSSLPTGPITAAAADAATGGYWLVSAAGGVFALGAPFDGSLGGHPPAAPVVAAVATADATGLRLAGADGGVFSFDAPFLGSLGAVHLARPVVGAAGF